MKLRNQKTGEIVEIESLDVDSPTEGIVGIPSFDRKGSYDSLAELNAEWEDYEEPKEKYNYYYLDCDGEIYCYCDTLEKTKCYREIGNYFETKEEAEKEVEKLKAWKRLKDKGIRFKSVNGALGIINFTFDNYCSGEPHSAVDDLKLLFGGDE